MVEVGVVNEGCPFFKVMPLEELLYVAYSGAFVRFGVYSQVAGQYELVIIVFIADFSKLVYFLTELIN